LIDHGKVLARLSVAGISPSRPGFYDDELFIAEERVDPKFLEEYARYVTSLPLDHSYIVKARRVIPVIARTLHAELVADGRLGACIDTGMIFSRILEQEGIWNFQVKGSLTIDFPAESGINTKYFWSWDLSEHPFASAHSWIVAPPFVVVDIAVKQQPYAEGGDLLPPIVLSETATVARPRIVDVFSPEFRAFVRMKQGVTDADIVDVCAPNWRAFPVDFPPAVLSVDGVSLRYAPIAVGAPDLPLNQMTVWPINGRLGAAVYEDVVKPALASARSEGVTSSRISESSSTGSHRIRS